METSTFNERSNLTSTHNSQLLLSFTSAWLGLILIIAPLFGHHPYRKEDTETLEKVQKRATKILPGLKNLP